MFNSAEMYEKMFIPTNGGFLYYPTKWSGGYLLTPEERDTLVADWRGIAGFKGTLKLAGLALVFIILVQLNSMALGVEDLGEPYIGFGIGSIMVGYIIWKFSAAYRLVRGRRPVMPRRTAEETREVAARVIPFPMLIFVFAGVSLSSASMLWLGLLGNWLAGLGGLLLAWSAYAHLRIILTRIRSRGDD